MVILSLTEIKNLVSPIIYLRGSDYFEKNRVKITDIGDDFIQATVMGTQPYEVSIHKESNYLNVFCTCPFWDTCKHVVATLLAAREFHLKGPQKIEPYLEERFWSNILERSKTDPQVDQSPRFQLVFIFSLYQNGWSLNPKKAYIRNDGELGRIAPIKSLRLEPTEIRFTPDEEFVYRMLQSGEYYYQFSLYRNNFHFGEGPGLMFDHLKSSFLLIERGYDKYEPLNISDEKLHFSAELKETNEDLSLHFLLQNEALSIDFEKINILTQDPVWILYQDQLMKVKNLKRAKFLSPFTKPNYSPNIPKKYQGRFLKHFLPSSPLFEYVKLPDSMSSKTVDQLTGVNVYLSEEGKRLWANVSYQYDEYEIPYNQTRDHITYWHEEGSYVQIKRDHQKEQEYIQTLIESGLRCKEQVHFTISVRQTINWLLNEVPKLSEKGITFYGEEKLKANQINRSTPTLTVELNTKIDWFDLNVMVDFGGVGISIRDLRDALSLNKKYVKLTDGSVALLPDEWKEKLQHVFSLGKVKKNQLHLSRTQFHLVDLLLSQAQHVQFDDHYYEIKEKIQQFIGIQSYPVPKGFQGTLRPYQQSGYNWLCFLQEFGFGGCLADDMGLGKTIQTLALLQREKENGNVKPNLIVVPTSLLFNWQREIGRFTPELKPYVHHGMAREKENPDWKQYDLVITSYGTLLRDIDLFHKFTFHYVILDESQKIKNARSKIARSVRVLNANHRLVLTGTPVENNTFELWSQFDFINPGVLGSQTYFRKSIARPIESDGNEQTAQFLRSLIYPFVLRRTKEEVEKELPPKVENMIYCEMSNSQRNIYEKWRNLYRASLLDLIDKKGVNRTKMKILEGLTRLRQISCHPNLVETKTKADSAKMESLWDSLEDVLSENHKVLIYSQFVKMLQFIRQEMDKQGISYVYLDGRTRKRQEVVDRFQNDKNVQVFLISLRAGGLGLNLTAADYVFLYDPWWNPAVEVQATDRTHRIGQDKKIFSYKLIARDTVEEKILQLQDRKKALASEIISTDSAFLKKLNREDIEFLFS